MPKLIVGSHMSIAKGFVVAARRIVEEYEGSAMQIFLKSPRGGGRCKLTDSEAVEFRKYAEEHRIFTVAHCSYLLNFAKDLSEKKWTLVSLIDDLENIERLGGVGVVLHIGKSLELPKKEALAWITKNIHYILTRTKKLKAAIILENTAGQGTELGASFGELAQIYRSLRKHKRIKFCLDTCHSFASGYDLTTPAAVKKTFKEFDKNIGIRNLACIHFNDSKVELDRRVDRHENLGRGFIGQAGLTAIARLAIQKKIPLILETPEKKTRTHKKDLKILRKWLSVK